MEKNHCKDINFFSENIKFDLKQKKQIKKWIVETIEHEKKISGLINIIFCNDNYLLEVNKTYLKKEYLTDIITFSFCENKVVSGDIFISIDRVKENAKIFITPFENELHRIIIHGILHLIGYNDKTTSLKQKMTTMENKYLKLIS